MNVAIRKFEERDIVNKIKWINDERNNRYFTIIYRWNMKIHAFGLIRSKVKIVTMQ